jgi:hypothetical protein
MTEKQQRFLKHTDRLYEVASRVGDREAVLRVGSTLLVVRGSVPELASAWNQFSHHVGNTDGTLLNHLRYFWAVMRNMRGRDSVTLVELTADVSFTVQVDVEASVVDMVA